MGVLTGKTVIITGASRGIGAAAAEAMAAEGASLMLLARGAADVTALAARLRKSGVVGRGDGLRRGEVRPGRRRRSPAPSTPSAGSTR